MSKEKELDSEIQKFLENFGEFVNDIQYDGWPIWWFFKERFLGDALPAQFIGHEEIEERIKKGKKPDIVDEIRSRAKIFFLRKIFYLNEKSKIWVSRFNKKESKLEENKKTVMFLIHTNAIIFKPDGSFEEDRFQSLIDEVRKDPELQEYLSIVDPLTHNSFLKLLKYENLLYNQLNPEVIKKIKGESSRLNNDWKRIREKIRYDSDNENLIWEYLRPTLNFFFSKEIISILLFYYEVYKSVIKKKDIKLLTLYAVGGPIIRCAIAAADRIGIRSLHVSHGLGAGMHLDLPNSLYHCVPGEEYKRKLVNLGIPQENIFVTGPAFMNDIVEYIKDKDIKRKRKRILFASNPTIEDKLMDKREWYSYLKKYFQDLKKLNTELIVKTHPRERNIEIYKETKGIRIITDQRKSTLYSLIRDSDLVISFGSTVSLEAVVIGTPTLIIDIMDFSKISDPFLSGEYVKHVPMDADISKVVDTIINNQKVRDECINNGKKFIQDYLYKVDGKADKRILKIMKELIL